MTPLLPIAADLAAITVLAFALYRRRHRRSSRAPRPPGRTRQRGAGGR
ncbi:hypothetical protein [Arthrobacter sp. UYEF36]